jgi:small subunit ribosomal protein S11
MGKKKIIEQNQEELIKQKEKVEAEVKKDVKVKAASISKEGRIYISSSYNNTIITLANNAGDVLTWTCAGSIGFKGAKKSTPFAASKVAEAICATAKKIGVEKIAVYIRGIGAGRDSAIRSLATHGLEIVSIIDLTPVPHNGCRSPKARRV